MGAQLETERVVACCWLPRFELQVMAGMGAGSGAPVALVSEGDAHPVVLDCDEAAVAEGVEPGMTVARAMGCCAALRVLPMDPGRIVLAAERFVQRLEAIGAAVQPVAPGRVLFDAMPLQRLYGGVAGVLDHVVGSFRAGTVRVGAGVNPFVAWVAAGRVGGGEWLRVRAGEERSMLAPMPLSVLPIDRERIRLLRALGLETLADVAALDVHAVADRFGADGLRMHALARGEDPTPLVPRASTEPVAERIAFPEPVANAVTLEHAAQLLAERLVAHPRCVQHAPRAVRCSAVLVEGGSWQARRVLRVPTVDARRIVLAIQPAFEELPGPIERMELALDGFELRAADQPMLFAASGVDAGTAARMRRGVRHVQATLGDEALLQVFEVEPWSRMPERHAALVPRVAEGEERTP